MHVFIIQYIDESQPDLRKSIDQEQMTISNIKAFLDSEYAAPGAASSGVSGKLWRQVDKCSMYKVHNILL